MRPPGIELMHMMRKDQLALDSTHAISLSDQLYALVAQPPPKLGTASSFLENYILESTTRQHLIAPDMSLT